VPALATSARNSTFTVRVHVRVLDRCTRSRSLELIAVAVTEHSTLYSAPGQSEPKLPPPWQQLPQQAAVCAPRVAHGRRAPVS